MKKPKLTKPQREALAQMLNTSLRWDWAGKWVIRSMIYHENGCDMHLDPRVMRGLVAKGYLLQRTIDQEIARGKNKWVVEKHVYIIAEPWGDEEIQIQESV